VMGQAGNDHARQSRHVHTLPVSLNGSIAGQINYAIDIMSP
jgi:hypothetical protein